MKKILLLLLFSSSFFSGLYAQAPRKVVIEDFTGIWCGYCPNGRTDAEHCEATFGTKVICIGVHSSDALSTGYPDNLVNGLNCPGFPSGAVDRFSDLTGGGLWQGASGNPSNDWDGTVTKRLNTTSPVAVVISSTYNTSTRALSATVTANFVASASGNMNLNCVLVEDSIETDGQQHNYMDADNTSPWYNKGDPITIYTQRDVARTNLSSTIYGDAGVIPTTVSSGASYNKTYTFTIPAGWNDKHVKIVGFVEHWGSSASTVDTTNIYIINAEVARLGQNTATGIAEQLPNGFKAGNCYPNPFSNVTAIPVELSENTRLSVKIYNILGIEVATLADENLVSGDHTFFWAGNQNDGSPAPNGVYYYRVTGDKQSVAHSVVLSR